MLIRFIVVEGEGATISVGILHRIRSLLLTFANSIILHHILLLLYYAFVFRNRPLSLVQFGPQFIADRHKAVPLCFQLANLVFPKSKFPVHLKYSSLLRNNFLLELKALAVAGVAAQWFLLSLMFHLLQDLLHLNFHDLDHSPELFIFYLK